MKALVLIVFAVVLFLILPAFYRAPLHEPIEPAQAASLVDDTFDGTTLDRYKWDEASQSGGQFTVNGQLIATTSAASAYSIPRMTSQYRLTGDFDFQVDYSIGAGWSDPLPSNSNIEIQMAVYWDDSRSVFIGRGKDNGGEYIRPATPIASQGGINNIRVPNSQVSGKLRAIRSGTTLTMKFYDGAAWQDLAAATVPNEDAYVYLGSFSGNASRAFIAYFDNFTLNSGPTSFHPFTRSSQFRKRSDFYVGGVVNDYLAYSVWGNQWQGVNPLDPLRQNGFKWSRVGVTTVSSSYLRDTPTNQWGTLQWRDEYWSSREFAGEVMRESQNRGYRLDLFLFLSHTAAHAGQQNAPPEWAGLSVAQTASLVDQYSFETTQYYMSQGLNIEIYEIGNEIQFGILNFRPGERIPVPPGVDITNNMDYLRNNVWNVEAQLLQASINGIKRANPNAKIVLHAAGLDISRSNVLVKSFFKTMIDYGVQYDYAGLSNSYNSPNWPGPVYTTDSWFQRFQEVIDYIAGLNKRVIIDEASYPHDPTGQPGSPMTEFPYTDSGQAAWAREHLRFLSNQPNVLGFFWFYPDYHMNLNVDPSLKGTALFQTPTQPVPAMFEFRVNNDIRMFDYDGDGKTDASVYRPSSGDWYLLRSTAGFGAYHFGSPSDILAPADYTGDGKTDVAVWRPSNGVWYVLRSEDFTFYGAGFGTNGDIPAPGDYDGDGKADLVVYRPGAQGYWYLQQTTAGFSAVPFGIAEDKPAIGDYDGDGKLDVSVYRPSLGNWYRFNSHDGSFYGVHFGSVGDMIVPGDYTGDGKTDNAIFRPSESTWYILRSEVPTFYSAGFGSAGDIPTPGDYDGDGKADLAVWRPGAQSIFYIQQSTAGFTAIPWGLNGDRPTANAYVY